MEKEIVKEEKIDEITLKIEAIEMQLEYHSNYFYERFFNYAESQESFKNKKPSLEFFTYHKAFNNLLVEMNELKKIVLNINEGEFCNYP